MDEIIKRMFNDAASGSGVFSLPEVIAALTLSFVLCLLVAYVYGITHRGLSYSMGYVHTMMMMGVTTTIIMLIIGSNIARAFSLVGALSIIRFRNAVKETRDVGFLFICMAIGMANGTGFYDIGVTFALFSCLMIYFLHRFGIGSRPTREMVLTVHLPDGADHKTTFKDCFFGYLEDHALLSMESIRGGTLLELVYSIKIKKGTDEGAFMSALREANANHKVSLLTGTNNAEI